MKEYSLLKVMKGTYQKVFCGQNQVGEQQLRTSFFIGFTTSRGLKIPYFKWNDLINCILHVFCLNCLLKSRTYYGMRCGKTSGIMTCLILTRVVIHELAVPRKSAILEIFFIESTSEFQTSVTFLLVNENIKCG